MNEPVIRTAGQALWNWWRAMTLDALIVGLLWLAGLLALHVPLAPLWAVLAGLLQFIPNYGALFALIGPVLSVLLSEQHLPRLWFLLGLYAVIMAVDGFLLQPYVLKRMARVPFWAALFVPILLGILIPFWGVLLAPPLLAVVYAFKKSSSALAK